MRIIGKNWLILLYLGAIVAANITVTLFGPTVSILTALLFIGLDLTTRDSLHEAWKGKGLWSKMLLLICSGSVLSFLINRAALKIAVASCVAFVIAGLVDFIIYSVLHKKKWMVKVNGSNVFSALADSIAFPTLAFGSFMPLIILGQFGAKTFGGLLWSLLLKRTIHINQ